MAQSTEIPSLFSDISSRTARQSGFLKLVFCQSLGIGMLGQITKNMITTSVFSKIGHKPNMRKDNSRSIESKPIE